MCYITSIYRLGVYLGCSLYSLIVLTSLVTILHMCSRYTFKLLWTYYHYIPLPLNKNPLTFSMACYWSLVNHVLLIICQSQAFLVFGLFLLTWSLSCLFGGLDWFSWSFLVCVTFNDTVLLTIWHISPRISSLILSGGSPILPLVIMTTFVPVCLLHMG